MVFVVNKSQQVRTAGLRPDPAYSRVEALELHIPSGAGNEDFCFTPTLGNSLILYGINMWIRCPTHPGVFGGNCYLMFGAGTPNTAAEMILNWRIIVPVHCGAKPGFRLVLCEHVEYYIRMKRKFIKDEIRFGAVFENLGQPAWEATILFEISEG